VNLCFVAHNAYGALSGRGEGHWGGVERQTALMARWFVSRGHRVSVITWDEGGRPEREEWHDGVRVIKLCARTAGWPGLRFFHPRWTSLERALARADAELYYHNCAEYVTGQVALFCRRRRRRFVYSVASDPECDPRLPTLATRRERWLYRYGLRRADLRIVQTDHQRRMLASGFGLPAVVLPMPCEGPASFLPPRRPAAEATTVLWVGRLAPVKRLEWLLELAERLPRFRFEVIGQCDAPTSYLDPLLARLRALPNVRWLGSLPPAQMPAAYRSAALLLCTSHYEGFPNTFLEAWSHGLPVVSTVDPDGLIASHGLGAVAGDVPALARAIRTLVEEPGCWSAASQHARRFFLERHEASRALPRFEAAFAALLGENPRAETGPAEAFSAPATARGQVGTVGAASVSRPCE
jgi:glycosyltransferase involved in cell wall biosynthesis